MKEVCNLLNIPLLILWDIILKEHVKIDDLARLKVACLGNSPLVRDLQVSLNDID